MTLRLGTPADIPAICSIEQIPDYREFIGAWSAEEHSVAMAAGDAEYLVTGENGAVEGFALLQGLLSPHRVILLRRVAVRRPGHGIGRALVRFAMTRAFEVHGAHRLWLDVFATNQRARHTYAQLGFQEEGLLRDSKWRDGAFHSQVLMALLEEDYVRSMAPPPTR